MFNSYFDYIKDNPKKHWFKAKLYGWGWTPATWQGWVVTAIYIFGVLALSLGISDNAPNEVIFTDFIFPSIGLTILFILVAYKTGEKPRWHWGNPDKNENIQ